MGTWGKEEEVQAKNFGLTSICWSRLKIYPCEKHAFDAEVAFTADL